MLNVLYGIGYLTSCVLSLGSIVGALATGFLIGSFTHPYLAILMVISYFYYEGSNNDNN